MQRRAGVLKNDIKGENMISFVMKTAWEAERSRINTEKKIRDMEDRHEKKTTHNEVKKYKAMKEINWELVDKWRPNPGINCVLQNEKLERAGAK